MNTRTTLRLLGLLFTLLLFTTTGCKTFKSDPETTFTVTNRSAGVIRNLEVTYTGGNFGVASIQPGASFRKVAPVRGECKLKVRYADPSNKEIGLKEVALGGRCPKALQLEIGADYGLTATEVK